MKGGVRLYITHTIHQKRLDLDERLCGTLHYIALHQKRIDRDEGWCETLHYITIHQKRIDLGTWWRWEVVTKGSGEEGKCWRRGSGGRREVVMKGILQNALKWVHECCMGFCFGEEAGAQNLVFFRVKWLQPAMKRYLLCAAGAVWIVSKSIGSSSVFCNEWLFLCA